VKNNNRKRKYRKSITGFRMLESKERVEITLNTLCPKKWVIVDTESGYIYCKKDNGGKWYGPSERALKDARYCINRLLLPAPR
jgi:hypothetical protein